MKKTHLVLVVGAAAALGFSTAGAAPVAIANSGFQADNVADNGVVSAVPASWT